MSKIYEALLRAEMDRVTGLNKANGQVKDAVHTSSVATRSTPARDVPSSASTFNGTPAGVGTELDEPFYQTDNPVWASTDEFEPQKLRWQPNEKRLPALEAKGVLVEQIRVLRSRLHELRRDRPLKTIMITSGLPQEGKSFVAANLAVGFAKFRNQRVLLIDGDMRRGKLHQVFGAAQEPGLTDYLSKKSSLNEVMQQMELPGSGPFRSLASLTFIPSGPDADNAADLSGNGRFESLLRSVYDHFDWIILDSSPVTLVADGVNLARACDGVVLVVRGGVTKYEVAQRAQQELKAAKVVGVVLNAVEGIPKVGGYYGYDG